MREIINTVRMWKISGTDGRYENKLFTERKSMG